MASPSKTEVNTPPAPPPVATSATVLPGGTTTRTTTYTMRTVPVTTTSAYTVHPAKTVTTGSPASAFSFDDLKKYVEEQGRHVLEDPRTKQLVESGQATWDDIKKYVESRASGPQADESKVVYTTAGGYWYPVMTHTAMVAAPSTIFEVGADTADLSRRICFRPRVDAYYDSKANRIVMFFDLPGFDKDTVDIEVDKGTLSVSGERTKVDEKSEFGPDGREIIKERCSGFFYRRFQLPSNAAEDSINANMDKGVLQIAVGLTEASSKTKKKIDVQ